MIGMSRVAGSAFRRRVPAVDLRQVQIHQDQIGPRGCRHRDPGRAIPGGENLILAEDIEPQLQHV
jgi:hypothetical protein